ATGDAENNDQNPIDDGDDAAAGGDDLENLEPIAPSGLCGFGVGFASLAGLASLGGVRVARPRRRRIAG
ncbi:MAG: hypothetical protein D6744_00515, partial [Planctomycetota bacterium]